MFLYLCAVVKNARKKVMKNIKNTLSLLFIFSFFSSLFASEVHLSKIEDYIEKNKSTKAYQYYQNALKEDATLETSSEGLFMKARVYDALFRSGKKVANIQLEKEALVSYVEVATKGTADYVTKSEVHLVSFEKFLQQKTREYTKAGMSVKSVELATTIASVHAEASNYLFLAKVEDYNRSFKKAHNHYLQAIKLDENQEEKIFERVLVLMNELGDASVEKLTLINKGLAKYPTNKELLIEKLHCYQKMGETDEVKLEELYLSIANVDSHNQYVLYALGKLYFEQGLKAEDKAIKWKQAKAYLVLASKSQYITSVQHEEVKKYLEEIQSQL